MSAPRGRTTATTLRHNPLNAVTATVERITDETGHTHIRKQLHAPPQTPDAVGRARAPEADGQAHAPAAGEEAWAASTDVRHWNYWYREIEVYRDREWRERLVGTGLGLPEGEVEEYDGGAVLYLEDVSGKPGPSFRWRIMRRWLGLVGVGRLGRRWCGRGLRRGFYGITRPLA